MRNRNEHSLRCMICEVTWAGAKESACWMCGRSGELKAPGLTSNVYIPDRDDDYDD